MRFQCSIINTRYIVAVNDGISIFKTAQVRHFKPRKNAQGRAATAECAVSLRKKQPIKHDNFTLKSEKNAPCPNEIKEPAESVFFFSLKMISYDILYVYNT